MIRGGLLPEKDTLIANLEDPRFPLSLSSVDLFQLYEVYLQNLQPSTPIVVLDEVQNVQGWEKFVRYLIESQKARVFVTGSSSKLLSREISTVLTDRHVDIEVFPLSFKEFLSFRDLPVSNGVEIAKQRVHIKRSLLEYLEWGGFPEVVLSEGTARRRELLFRYFDDIVIKDVVKRYGVKEIHKLENLANLLVANMASLQAFNKLKARIGASVDTVERFCSYLGNARMLFLLKKFDYSAGEQIRSVNKAYIVDPGFYTVKGFKFSENSGRIAENTVAIELWRRKAFNPQLEIYYWKNHQQKEVDFVIKEGTKVNQLIQVCWDIREPQTKKRETQNLLKAGADLDCNDLLVITEDYESEERASWTTIEKNIRFVPLWKWLLE